MRLRPVLITVGATVIALFPLALHGGPLWTPLCYAQIGGLSAATFITLLLVPVLYAIFVLPQTKFLEFLVGEAAKYPSFQLVMGANVQRLLEEDGRVCGVEYLTTDGSRHQVRTLLTVGADGRFSRVRQLVGFTPIKTSPPIDVLWFRVPRVPGEFEESTGLLGRNPENPSPCPATPSPARLRF